MCLVSEASFTVTDKVTYYYHINDNLQEEVQFFNYLNQVRLVAEL
jgi:hypothetical protein